MPGKSPVVVVDTTAFYSDLQLEFADWQRILRECAHGRIQLWIPEVVLHEAARHYLREVQSHHAKATAAVQHLNQLGRRISSNALPTSDVATFVQAALDNYKRYLETRAVDAYDQQLRQSLANAGARILPIPQIPHVELVARSLAERKPFRPKPHDGGKTSGTDGYRDALIWFSVVEAATSLTNDDALCVVTANHKDFCGQDHRTLDQALLDDLTATPMVKRYETLKAMLEVLSELEVTPDAPTGMELWRRPALRENLRDAIQAACNQFTGEEVEDPYSVEKYSTGLPLGSEGFPPMESVTVQAVEPDLDTIALQDPYDSYESGEVIARVTVQASVSMDGFMFKSDYYGEYSDVVNLHDGDWNDSMVWVYTEHSAILTFDATVNLESNEVEVAFDSGELQRDDG
ncbi:PIN domain-containing protein [Nonomuraea wenchangensis]|uniref:PIN domain-containing protein n=1 Tax=Nonomuraea wenchangensis TaxID=568860 RepID=UPI003412869A